MSIFNRIFKVGQAAANKVVDKLEDPVEMTEQGIRDLKDNLAETVRSLAEVKGIAIRSRKAADQAKQSAADYGKKAEKLVGMGDDENALLALEKQETKKTEHARHNTEAKNHETGVAKMQTNVNKIKATIQEHEDGLITVRARQRTADATKKVNKQMANIDSSGTVAMLERMKAKVEETEIEAESYADLNDGDTSDDAKLDAALNATGSTSVAEDKLAAMKKKMGK